MSEVIKGLWIGDSLGILEQLSIRSFLNHGHDYHLYCYSEIKNIPSGVEVKDANQILPQKSIFSYKRGPGKGSFAVFANLFRYKLLLENGGWWADTDVICLKPFDFNEKIIYANQFTQEGKQLVNTAVIKVPVDNEVVARCYELAKKRFKWTIKWGETGPHLFNRVVLELGLQNHVKDYKVFSPLHWWKWKSILSEDQNECEKLISQESYAIHMWHEMWRQEELDEQKVFSKKSCFGKLLLENGFESSLY